MMRTNSPILKSGNFNSALCNHFRVLDINNEQMAILANSVSNYFDVNTPILSEKSSIIYICEWILAQLKPIFPSFYTKITEDRLVPAFSQEAVTFDKLLNFCWASGVPVIPMEKLGKVFNAPPYIVLRNELRPVIFFNSSNDCTSTNLYKLAHALCAIECNSQEYFESPELAFCWGGYQHVQKNNLDRIGIEMHEKTIKFLTKYKDIPLESFAGCTLPGKLALECDLLGEMIDIEPGVLALLVADQFLSWDVAKDALEYLDKPETRFITSNICRVSLNLSRLSVEKVGVLDKLLF